MRKILQSSVSLRLASAAVILAGAAWLSYEDWREYQRTAAHAESSGAVIGCTYRLRLQLKDAQAAEREYLLSGDEQRLSAYLAASSQVVPLLNALRDSRAYIADSEAAARLPGLVEQALREWQSAVDARRAGQKPSAPDAAARPGPSELENVANELIAAQRAQLAEKSSSSYRYEGRTRALMVVGTIILGLLLAAAAARVHSLVSNVKAAESRYRLLFERNPQPMWVYDRSTLAFLAVNHAAVRRYGYSESEFLRMTLKDLRPPRDIVSLSAADAGPWHHQTRDGRVLTVEIIEHPIEFDHRDAYIVMPRDITEQEAARHALCQSQERLQLAFDAANEGLWDWNLQSGSAYYSPRYYHILGCEVGDLTSDMESTFRLIHPSEQDSVRRQFTGLTERQGGVFSLEFRLRKKNGDYIWILCRGRIVDWTDRRTPLRIIGTITDISDRKALEAQYRQAQKLESIGQLAGGIAHDFNNLLTVINGYSSMLLGSDGLTLKLRDRLQQIHSAGERAASLTHQLLVFSRKQVLQPSVLNINQSVKDVEKMLRRLIGEHIELDTRLSSDVGNIMADEGQLQQVIINLSVNARDAMPKGGRLTIESANVTFTQATPGTQAGRYVLLAISDNGIGMTPEVKERVFEPFFTTKPTGSGTGLGLATVYGIVKQSGGWIDIDTTVGKGTRFRVYFPRSADPLTAAAPDDQPEPLGNETILLVEDQLDVRNLAENALRQYGYQVHACANAAEAIPFARSFPHQIDLLITDVVMPGAGGRELARELARLRPGLSVLFISGYTNNDGLEEALRGESSGYLQKPFTPSRLAAKVRALLGPRAGECESTPRLLHL